MTLNDVVDDYWETTKREVPSTTSAIILYTPINACIEKAAYMSHTVSIRTRLISVPMAFIEIPMLLFLRKYYHKFVGTNENSTQRRVENHDKVFAMIMTATMKPIVYYYMGERNGWKMASATIGSMAVNAAIIKPALYIMDICKDLMGNQSMQEARKKRGLEKKLSDNRYIFETQNYIKNKALRFENWLEKKSLRSKKRALMLIAAGSFGATSIIYSVTPTYYKPGEFEEQYQKITHIINYIIEKL